MTGRPAHPGEAAQRLARRALPRRFYSQATVGPRENGFAVLLDGRVAKTPARNPLVVAQEPIATVLAAEWAAQGDFIDPAAMPVTRIVNAAVDRVRRDMAAVRVEIVTYADSDLVCYRAGGPQSLVDAQEAAWSPLIAWAQEGLGARLTLAAGVVPVAQDASVAAAIEQALAPLDALSLAALSTVTTLTGSAIIALALARGRVSAEAAWVAAHVDENWQMSRWGSDEALLAQRKRRWREMEAAALILEASRS